MSLFRNGHDFAVAIALPPPSGEKVPYVRVEMAGPPGVFVSVIGKLDTGAFMTMLNSATAGSLGIEDATKGGTGPHTAHAANDQPLPYYVHRVIVRVANPGGEDLEFPLEAAVAEQVRRNLFGMDWFQHVCAAVDRRQIHLLRD